MHAITLNRYGSPDVLQLEEVERPMCGDDEVLVEVRGASVNPVDWVMMTGEPYFIRLFFGLLRPKNRVSGRDGAGIVRAVGSDVTHFKPGDEVFGGGNGAFAQYMCVPEEQLGPKPANLSFEEAAAVPVAALTALQGLRKGGLEAGQRVLINGASGGVGTFAVQIARSLGAIVTGVCSTRNIEMVSAIGADHVVDYTQENFTESGKTYDMVFDLIGNHSFAACNSVLTPNGTYVLAGVKPKKGVFGPITRMVHMFAIAPFVGRRMVNIDAKRTREDMLLLSEMLSSGVVKPVIDRTYTFDETAEAMRYLGKGHARGKVVITV